MTKYHKELEIPVWVKKGTMMVRRDSLSRDDPDNSYNYIKNTYGVDPEEYGVFLPELDKCSHCGHDL